MSIENAVSALEKFEKYEAFNGAVVVDKKNLYLFGQLVAINLKDNLAINLCGEPQFANILSRHPAIQVEKYGDSLFLNGEILTIGEDWIIVNKKYGNWHVDNIDEIMYEYNCDDYDYDYDYSEYISANPPGEY